MSKCLAASFGAAAVFIACTALAVERSELERSSVKAASDCVAQAALNDPDIITLYRQNRLKEVTDRIVLHSSVCDNPLRAMRLLHDRIYGRGTGQIFLRGDYLADLPRAVHERIRNDIEGSYAGLPPPAPNVDQPSSGTALRVVRIPPNDALNIREYPTDQSRIIDIIPPDATGVISLGETQGEWIFVQYDRAKGWVNRRFVQPLASRGERFR
jgi:hypothetical protein